MVSAWKRPTPGTSATNASTTVGRTASTTVLIRQTSSGTGSRSRTYRRTRAAISAS
jgi:hypothetical protein